MKTTINTMISIGLMIILMGCGLQEDSSTSEEVDFQQLQEERLSEEEIIIQEEIEQVKISITSMHNTEEMSKQAIESVVEAYEEKNQHIAIEYITHEPTTIWQAAVAVDYIIDKGSDILHFSTDKAVNPIIDRDQLVSIEEIRQDYPSYGENINDQAFESIKYTDGSHYALPIVGDYQVLFCNADLFEVYDIDLPTTGERFEQAIKKFDEIGITPIATSMKEQPDYWLEYGLFTALEGSGLEQVDMDITQKIWEQALGTIKSLSDQNAFSDEAIMMTYEEAQLQFINKEAAMFLGSATDLSEESVMDGAVKKYAIPLHSKGISTERYVTVEFLEGYYISKRAWEDSAKKEVVIELMNELTTDEMIEKELEPNDQEVSIHSINISQKIEESIANTEPIDIKPRIKNHVAPKIWEYMIEQIPLILKGDRMPEEVIDEMDYLDLR